MQLLGTLRSKFGGHSEVVQLKPFRGSQTSVFLGSLCNIPVERWAFHEVGQDVE